ncbi:MAG: YlxR family protein [Lachnospiraceae bacterium]|nr:YlxR family protein [Lachnospiraceae bacterium]MCR5768387.1 YlxR family protein [Lachnospiraceae bacterium]
MMIPRKIPMRKCTGCNELKPKKELIRVIVTPDDTVELDTTGKKNGRGAYICAKTGCLKEARKHKGLEKSLKKAIPPEVYDSLEKELIRLEGER